MLHQSNEWGLIIASHTGQPAANFGASVTPGNNVYGAYASVIAGASVTDDVYGIWINVNSNSVSGAARDALVTIGIDPAGGTAFTDFVNHLGAACADVYAGSTYNTGGIWYFFPVFIKAGTSIGAKATVNNATVGTCHCWVRLLCKPSRPELVRAGSFVRTFGDVAATSKGTDATPGTTSEGAWVQLGAALAEPLWFWQLAMGMNNAVESLGVIHADLSIGDATNKRVVVEDQFIRVYNTEGQAAVHVGAFAEGAVGDLVYGRMQGNAASATGKSMLAYGVGG